MDRCQTDHRLALAAEAAADAQLRSAIDGWAAGDLPAARQAVEQSLQLQRTPLAIALRGLLMRPASPGKLTDDSPHAAEPPLTSLPAAESTAEAAAAAE